MYLWVFLYDSGCDIVYRDDQCMHIYLQELLLLAIESAQVTVWKPVEGRGYGVRGQETLFICLIFVSFLKASRVQTKRQNFCILSVFICMLSVNIVTKFD